MSGSDKICGTAFIIYFIYLTGLLGTSTSSKWIHIQGKRQKMDRHTPKGSVRTGHGVPCGALPLIKTKEKKENEKCKNLQWKSAR